MRLHVVLRHASAQCVHDAEVELAIGTLLVVTGIAIFTGSLAEVSNWILETFPSIAEIG